MDAKTDASVDLRASRYALVSRLADDLAHEIRNPLHAMVINLEVLRRRVAAGDAEIALERAAVIEHEIDRTHRLVDLMLKLVRPDRDDSHLANGGHSLAGALEEVLPLIAIQARLGGVAFHCEDVDVDAPVRVSHGALKFAVLSLAAPVVAQLRSPGEGAAGGELRITVTHGSDVRIRVSAPAHALPDAAAIDVAARFLDESGGTTEAAADGTAIYLVLPRVTGA